VPKHRARPPKHLGFPELKSIKLSRFPKNDRLIKRLASTAEAALKDSLVLEEKLQLLTEKTEVESCARPDAERLVVMIYGDGFVEVYGEKWHKVKVIEVPKVSSANEGCCIDYVCDSLPLPYRGTVLPGKVVGVGNVSGCPSISALRLAAGQTEILKTLAKVMEDSHVRDKVSGAQPQKVRA